jgi:glucuronokinase
LLLRFPTARLPQPLDAPSLILAVENEDLGIAGGLQDRVIQVYEGLVYMDFDPAREQIIDGYKTYAYEPLDPALLPPLYVAYSAALSEPTEIFHNDIRGRYNRGEAQVVNAMKHFAEIAYQGRAAILQRDGERLAQLINENFDTRRSIYNIAPWQVQMVETARACGASAKFAGSGGAIIGTYRDEAMFERVSQAMAQIGCKTIKPEIIG